jgi:hypothetical protein
VLPKTATIETRSYVLDRKQFGRHLAANPLIQKKLTMFERVNPTRFMRARGVDNFVALDGRANQEPGWQNIEWTASQGAGPSYWHVTGRTKS